MRRIAMWVLAVGLAAVPAMASSGTDKKTDSAKPAATTSTTGTTATGTSATNPNQPGTTTQPAGSSKADDAKKSDDTKKTNVEEEVDELRAMIRAQAEQIETQHKELESMKARMGTEPVNGSSANSSTPADSNASAAPADSTATNGTASVAVATPTPRTAGQDAAMDEKPSPLFFRIGSAKFTPGGFLDLTGVFRTTGTGNGIGTSFGGIPLNNNFPTAGLTETRLSAQNSRISLKVEAPVAGGNITGYVEADFLGAIAANANITSNSNSLRMRVYFGDYRRGKWEFLAGQDWSMLTPNRKSISPYPSDIFYSQDMDTNYQVGLTWTRQPQVRVLFHPSDNWTMGVSFENADQLATTAISAPAAFTAVAGQVDQTSGGTLATPPTPNVMPDVILKLANDAHLGDKLFHWEVAGLISEFKLVTPPSVLGTTTAQTMTRTGGGVSANFNLELFKNFRLIMNSFYSQGGGRYIFGLGPDLAVTQATTTSPFNPVPLHAASGIGGFEYQATKSQMIYAYYGGAYYDRFVSVDPATEAVIGYGFAHSSASDNRAIQEYTIGWVPTFWQSPNFGKLQLITQYSYLTRAPWWINPTPVLGATNPRNAHLNMVYLDIRYVLP
jgi:hypothetical protein